jgi:hypothetical protein
LPERLPALALNNNHWALASSSQEGAVTLDTLADSSQVSPGNLQIAYLPFAGTFVKQSQSAATLLVSLSVTNGSSLF